MAKDTIHKNKKFGKKVCNFRREAKISITAETVKNVQGDKMSLWKNG